ncbi:hypothetical protein N665_1343s0008 [Sinapis alba]|nr:hypothetical protein N665_1343s0008 [Sinapis alba]
MLLTLKPFVPITLKPRFSYSIPLHSYHHVHFYKSPLKLRTYAQNGSGGNNDLAKEFSGGVNRAVSNDGGGDDPRKDRPG